MGKERLVREVAGLLSTIDFNPALRHPQDCLPWAEEVVDHVLEEVRTSDERLE